MSSSCLKTFVVFQSFYNYVVFSKKCCFFLKYVVLILTEARFVGDKVIYSQIDMTRKTSSPSGLSLGGLSGGSSGGGSSGCPAASGGNKGHNHLTVVQPGGPGNARGQPQTSYSAASTASDHSDPLSWAPLLGNRSGPESSLWWKITHFHAPILLKISSTEKSIELCSTKSWRLFFEIWRSEQRNIFVKLKLFGYFFWAV